MIRLDIDREEVSRELVERLIQLHDSSKFKKLQDYYEGKHEILERQMADEEKPNNKLVNSFPTYIVNVMQGYFMGEPVKYSSQDEEHLKKLMEIFDANDEQHVNSVVAKEASVKGKGYEVIYADEDAQTNFAPEKAENVIMVYDTKITPEPLFAIRFYSIQDMETEEDKEKVEVYTEDKIYFYTKEGESLSLEDEAEHFFGGVPIVEYLNNGEGIGDFERVIKLIDAYDKAQSDKANDFEYFADAYLALTGMDDTDEEDIKKMKENRVLLLDENGNAEWLTKQQDYVASRDFMERLEEDIHKFAQVPNLSDEQFSQNLSGVSIRYKLWGMEQAVATKERHFKKGLQRRIRLLTNFLNLRGGGYDYRNIQLTFNRNIPENTKEAAEIAQHLMSFVSKKTLLAHVPFVDDPQEELERIEEEREERVSLDDYDDEDDEDGEGEEGEE